MSHTYQAAQTRYKGRAKSAYWGSASNFVIELKEHARPPITRPPVRPVRR